MWTEYDRTIAEWVCRDDIIQHRGKVITVNTIDDDTDPDAVYIFGINEMDDEIEVRIPCGNSVSLVYWQD